MDDILWDEMLERIACEKCKMWNLAANENGYARGMCEDCFNKSYVCMRNLNDINTP
jgi:hypothetical protein